MQGYERDSPRVIVCFPCFPIRPSDCWNALARRQIQRHIEGLNARLRAPNATLEEQLEVQAQLADLKRNLQELPPPSRPFLG